MSSIASATASLTTVAEVPMEGERKLTCLKCGLDFPSTHSQLAHYRSDLHIVNLRRQLVGLLPFSADDYQATKINDDNDDDSDDSDDTINEDDNDTSLTTNTKSQMLYTKHHGPRIIFHTSPQHIFHISSILSSYLSQRDNDNRDSNDDNTNHPITATHVTEIVHQLRSPVHVVSVILLLRSGRFAGAVFQGDSLLAHKVSEPMYH